MHKAYTESLLKVCPTFWDWQGAMFQGRLWRNITASQSQNLGKLVWGTAYKVILCMRDASFVNEQCIWFERLEKHILIHSRNLEIKLDRVYATSHWQVTVRRVFMVHGSSGWQIYTRASHNPHLSWTANLLYGRDSGTHAADWILDGAALRSSVTPGLGPISAPVWVGFNHFMWQNHAKMGIGMASHLSPISKREMI